MRKTIIAGNWKMYKDLSETTDLIDKIKVELKKLPSNTTVVLCPPFTSLALAGAHLKGTPVKLGAQDMSAQDEGAYTGEISWKMLKATGCEYVILGHSERRQYHHETNELVNLKAKKALANGLVPIICVGETLNERETGITESVVSTQIKGVLNGFSSADMGKTVIAYEPVWAIGTGKNATPEQAQEVHQHIRKLVSQLFDWTTAEGLVIQYGGSVKPDNAADLLRQNDIDGALVGGACLKADSFAAIVRSAKG
jgi:triosephosphate isomerase